MASYKKFGLEDELAVPDNNWFYKNQQSTSGSAYPYNGTETRFGATSATKPLADPDNLSDGYIIQV